MFEGFEVISAYTTQDAIDDGVLMDVTKLVGFTGEGCGQWCVTQGIVEAANAKDDGRTLEQKIVPLVRDAAMIINDKIRQLQQDGPLTMERLQDETGGLITEGLEGNVTGETVWMGLNETRGWTLMFPSER